MKNKITLGMMTNGKPLALDLGVLLETRLLIQASSGGGKSMTLRTLLEMTYGLVPQIVLDLEGDFASLREKFDYVLAGKAVDIPADPRSAALLARKVMELDLSLIVDLFDLAPSARHEFVRNFLQAMLDAPKHLWRHRLLVIDEAHKFCPENGEGSSVAKETVIQVCDSGRKRGIGTVLATQRLAKLDKSAAAECGNKLIGMTFYDDDRKRAARELGLRGPEEIHNLGKLEPGHFKALGRALSRDLVEVQIDKATTRHPKAGDRARFKAPKPTARMKATLAKLMDLPKEAEKEAQDIAAALVQIRDLKGKLALAERVVAKPAADPAALNAARAEGYWLGNKELSKAMAHTLEGVKADLLTVMGVQLKKYLNVADLAEKLRDGFKATRPTPTIFEATGTFTTPIFKERKIIGPGGVMMTGGSAPAEKPTHTRVYGQRGDKAALLQLDGAPLKLMERKVLAFLSVRPDYAFSKTQVAAMIGASATGGGFQNAMGRLKGVLTKEGEKVMLTQEAADQVRHLTQGLNSSLKDWLASMKKAERLIYEQLLARPGSVISREELASLTEYQPTGGGFQNACGRLCTLGLAIRSGNGLSLNPELQEFL